MNRKAMYGSSLRKLKEIRDELEQRQVDMDNLEQEIEEGYAALEEQRDTLNNKMREASRMRKSVQRELECTNKFHPDLMTNRYIDGNAPVSSPVQAEENALRVRVTAPTVGFDEENDRALIKFTHMHSNDIKTEVYAISLGTFKETRYNLLEAAIEETAEKINTELWDIVKENCKHG